MPVKSSNIEKSKSHSEEGKKTILDDVKKIAKKFKLGPCVLCFQMTMNDMENAYVANASASQAATLRGVLETNELLENIICYLPLKKILDVQRVSRQWKNVIASSPNIQEKLFMRRANKEQELWIMVKREPGRGNVKDKPLRVKVLPTPDTPAITPVSLNPMLRVSRSWHNPNGVRFPVSMLPDRYTVTFPAWANALRYNESCVRNMFVTDPPCNRAHIKHLTIYFGSFEACLQHPKPHILDPNHPKQYDLCVKVSGITVESASGLTMGDIFKAAINERGNARCTLSGGFYFDRGDTTMHEIIDVLKKMFGWTGAPVSPYMELSMEVSGVGSTSMMIAGSVEREMANEPETYRREVCYKFD